MIFFLVLLLLLLGCCVSGTPLYQPISFTVFVKQDGVTGNVSFDQLQAQVNQLNLAFSGTEARRTKYKKAVDAGIRFTLSSIRYVVSDEFFDLCTLPSEIKQYRPKYMTNPAIHLNVYVCWNQNNLGLAWLPYEQWFREPISESHYSLGAIVHWQLLPGNTYKGGMWKKGNILTHEVGHCYGLKHPYEGDCFGDETNSDNITDTPRMTGNPLNWCNQIRIRDSCPMLPGKDDLSNYMIATSCTNHFTQGQVQFMKQVIHQYKPTLARQSGLPTCVSAMDSTDASPDLQPCVKIMSPTQGGGRKWCVTDPDDSSIWGWACCPTSLQDTTCTTATAYSTRTISQPYPH